MLHPLQMFVHAVGTWGGERTGLAFPFPAPCSTGRHKCLQRANIKADALEREGDHPPFLSLHTINKPKKGLSIWLVGLGYAMQHFLSGLAATYSLRNRAGAMDYTLSLLKHVL